MNFLRQIYKYSLLTVGGLIFIVSLYMSFNMDLVGKSGGGNYTDGFGNRQNPDNGKAYWNATYLGERAIQVASFFGGISLIGFGWDMKKKEDGSK